LAKNEARGYSNKRYSEKLYERCKIYWCDNCNHPIESDTTQTKAPTCHICENEMRYIAKDIRPVFSRERRILQFFGHGHLTDAVVWKDTKSKNYIINGKIVRLPNFDKINEQLDELAHFINDSFHYDALDNKLMQSYFSNLEANQYHLNALEEEAFTFVRETSKRYKSRMQMISFSGGKDSTVVSSLVRRALGTSDILHVFGDTTLEDPNTYQYVEEFREENPLIPFFEAKAEHDFHQLVEEIGPPSRQMRWCCTIMKAGPINNLLQTLGDQKVLTFYGVRRAESKQRSEYHAVTVGAKIGNQITASPIINWTDFDIWLYLLRNKVKFNSSYLLGFTRVGCWLCPMNSPWSDTLAEIFFPEDHERWRNQLIEFAKKIGKPDPEVYVDTKRWKARFGGRGLSNAYKGIVSRPCGDMDNTIQYQINRPIDEGIFEFFKPLGEIKQDPRRAELGEFRVLNEKEGDLIIQAVPGDNVVRVTFLNPKNESTLQARAKYQINKFQTCIQCTACSAVCPTGAIIVRPEERIYSVDPNTCINCNECVEHFGSTGCLVAKSLSDHRQ
jgi:phosphoadenosine phosphosulfate reductase